MRFYDPRAGQGRPAHRRRFDREGRKALFQKYRHGGSRGGFGGRGEGKRFFERGKFKFALLELLASQPMHGYQLIKAMEDNTGGLYTPSPGSIYPNLQLLEDMQLISSSEADGKKLYHITDEGRTYLRENGQEDTEAMASRREYPGKHRARGGYGKHYLRGFMKEWSEAIELMARTAEAVREHPSSHHAAQFQALMTQFQGDLKQLLDSASKGTEAENVQDTSAPAAPPAGDAPQADDHKAGE